MKIINQKLRDEMAVDELTLLAIEEAVFSDDNRRVIQLTRDFRERAGISTSSVCPHPVICE